MKTYSNKNVYEAAQERVEYIFDTFDNVLVAFSGGKDSSVLLHLAYDYAKETGQLDKLAMYHLDYEAQYQMTTDYVTDVFENQFPEVEKWWICLPIGAQCACSMTTGTWIPWEKRKEDIWVRPMPDSQYVINEDNAPFPFEPGTQDYQFQDDFGAWYAEKHGKTAILIGLRADESLNRYRAVSSKNRVNVYDGQTYILKKNDVTFNCYPLYDWTAADIWIYNGKFQKTYNHLYDLYYQAGLTIDQMRVASPFNDCAMDSLKLYRVIDPDNWGKMIGRVNGVNFAGLYGGTTAMGWKNITKPDHMTWKEYCFFLLNTLDEETREHYLEKLKVSIKFWAEKGGALDPETIQELTDAGIEFINRGPGSRSTKDQISFKDYPDEIPGVTKFKDVPSYKRMCVCIIKNDYACKYMGFAQTKKEIDRRKRAMEKYKNL